MELERGVLVSPTGEVPVIEGELVTTIRELAGRGAGSKTIARTVGVARNTVRRYLWQPIAPGAQVRPTARRLTDDARQEARTLYEGSAGGNAMVVQASGRDRMCGVENALENRRSAGMTIATGKPSCPNGMVLGAIAPFAERASPLPAVLR